MKKQILENKKAEMSSSMLVTIILLVIGFGLILIVYYQLNGIQEVDRQVCHQSVVLRWTLPDTLDLKDLSSLKCKTRKICISDKMFGKGDCENELGKEYDTLKISKEKEKAEQDIKKIFADELADCWAMMGEGKIQVFKREGLPPKDLCVICSRINFDKNVDVSEVSGLSEYLIKKRVPNKDMSYFQFLTNSKTLDYSFSSSEIDKLDTKEKAIIFTEFYETKYTQMLLMIPVGVLSLKLTFVAGPLIGGVFFLAGGKIVENVAKSVTGDPDYFSSIYIADYDANNITKLGCDVIK